ncbi:MAG: DUF4325 domain-containing protein [Patescibacteria group bacterium]|jgi:hypothetical protein
MTINIAKFGTVLTSRQAGKEAYAAFSPSLASLSHEENILVDFDGVSSFSPSWGDEFLTPLQRQFGDRLILKNTTNPSVSLTIVTLEGINGLKFKKS